MKLEPARLPFLAGVFFFSFFVILAITWQAVFDLIMKSQLKVHPSSTIYRMWVKNPVPIYLKIYLFNISNAEEFMRNRTVSPNFEEVGPFVFEESREKVNISWNDSEETVSFNQTKRWRLLHEESKDFSIRITNLNPIASTIAHMSKLWKSNLQREIANALINRHESLLVTASAQEWLFDGIPDKFLDIFDALRKVTDIPIPYSRFGWFYDRNASSSFDGIFTMKTGKSDTGDLGMMVAWNNANRTQHYEGACAEVRGSTGEIIPPLTPFQKSLRVFSSEICSYIELKYSGPATAQGINAYEYVGDDSVFDNGTFYPENLCFYLGESCPSGSRNVSSCRFGSPAFISFPHFYLAESEYTEKITGMNPDAEKHKFTLKVEPETGVPLAVKGCFQINFRVEPYAWCDQFRGVPKIYVPMLWFEQTVQMSWHHALLLKCLLFMANNGSYLFYGFSFLIFLTFISVFLIKL